MVDDEVMSDLRRCLRSIYDVCEECGADGAGVEFMGVKMSIRQLFELEVTAYLLCLTAADGVFSEEEIAFVNELMGRDYSLEKCMRFVSEHRMASQSFTKSMPVSFKILVDWSASRGKDVSDVLLSFYAGLSAAMASSDDEIARQEREVAKEYLHLLRGYKALKTAEREELEERREGQ